MTAPLPGPQRRGPRAGLIIGIIGLVAVLCTGVAGVVAVYVFRDSLPGIAAQGDYSQPKDVCALIIGDMGEQAGPVSGRQQLGYTCTISLAGELGENELRVFVAVEDAVELYNRAGADFGNRDGFVGDVIADLGDAAFFTRRLLEGGGLVDAKLACVTGNLYVELRFHAMSKRAWSSDDVRARLTAAVHEIMRSAPRG
ncbi:hypothetical protein ACFO1B_38780 [Dactylosporangium siamense]|uniref:Uncharacterized protein n=1 Tax=Dactylosporangium siamense TaxID=685454 RepID=A0A919PXW9_9ACTN|nr:hypothetical protein [Dactylosporangium siamense]GIG50375.1 hypothetical protein Dsi01nite_084160 [Dactylosporangium siamense]